MTSFLFDTDVVSYFLKGYPTVQTFVSGLVTPDSPFTFTLVTYYEILSGLFYRDARRQLEIFQAFSQTCRILPLTPRSVNLSAEIYADLRQKGTPVDDIDLLIAGIALEHEMVLVTHNVRHFGKIERLSLHPLMTIE